MTYHFNTFQIEDDTVFYSSEFSYAFTNLKCFRPGHVLVCPKRVVKYIDELSWVEQKDLVETVQRVAKAMLEFYHLKPSGVTLTLQDGKGAGQSVPHVHYHVIPMIPTEPTSHSKQYYDLVKSGNFGPVESLKPYCRPHEQQAAEAALYREFLESGTIGQTTGPEVIYLTS